MSGVHPTRERVRQHRAGASGGATSRSLLAAGAMLITVTTLGLSWPSSPASDTAQNVVLNGTFDESLTGWQAGKPTPPPSGWRLVWSDEFTGKALDRSAWNVLNNSTFGDGNKELACLMDRPENVRVSDGVLIISALEETTPIVCGSTDARFPDGRGYSSALLSTQNKLAFEYGRFEIRAKTPLSPGTSKGIWPAFWMRPAAGGIGELDILEAIGTGTDEPFSANRVVQAIHYDYVNTYDVQDTSYELPSGTTAGGFHTYAVEWGPGVITWFVDGVETSERTLTTTPWIDQAFVNEFYLRLNLAVGGSWPGSPDADTVFPAEYQVDYVRVYQRHSTLSGRPLNPFE